MKVFLNQSINAASSFLNRDGAGGGPLLGHDFISLLEKHQPILHWDEKAGEHLAEYVTHGERHVVVYPTLASIYARLKLARAWGLGLSIWEIGQGLDYFYDLL